MAVVHRPSDIGIDLPAGASADDLAPTDYHPMEMVAKTVDWAIVHRPGDMAIDLPAGASADDLAPEDYRVIDLG